MTYFFQGDLISPINIDFLWFSPKAGDALKLFPDEGNYFAYFLTLKESLIKIVSSDNEKSPILDDCSNIRVKKSMALQKL